MENGTRTDATASTPTPPPTATAPGQALPEPLRSVLERAAAAGGTDIHIDPVEGGFAVRRRVDGLIQEQEQFSFDEGRRLINEIKVVAELEIEHAHEPLESHFRWTTPDGSRSLRVSLIPTLHTEAVHLRMLRVPGEWRDLANLGMSDEDHQRVLRGLGSQGGLALIAGPTGAGKTTTLYALAAEAKLPEMVAASIEDPIEYDLPYLRQLQVDEHRGLNMYEGLRILLRMDADMLVIGEIRDRASAVTAARAALSGRLVLATIHARDAAGAIETMHYEGVPSHVLGEALQLVVAQNLVRRVRPETAQPRPLRESEQRLYEEAGLQPPQNVPEPSSPTSGPGDGYYGRVGVFEAAPVDNETGAWIARGQPREKIQQRFREQGARPLVHDALGKAAQGLTSMQEVLRLREQGREQSLRVSDLS